MRAIRPPNRKESNDRACAHTSHLSRRRCRHRRGRGTRRADQAACASARCAARCWAASAASARWSRSRSTAIASRCWSRARTASAPSCASRSTPGGTTRWASTWSPCASTTSSCRAPSRCFSSTTIATGELDVDVAERGDRGHRRGLRAGGLRPGRRRDGRDAGHVPRRGLRSCRASASASSRRSASSTASRTRPGDVVLGSPSSGPALQRLLADPQDRRGRAAPMSQAKSTGPR